MATGWNTTKARQSIIKNTRIQANLLGLAFFVPCGSVETAGYHTPTTLTLRNGDEMKWIIAVFTFIAQNWTAISALSAAMVPAKEAVTAHLQLAAARASVLSGGVA